MSYSLDLPFVSQVLHVFAQAPFIKVATNGHIPAYLNLLQSFIVSLHFSITCATLLFIVFDSSITLLFGASSCAVEVTFVVVVLFFSLATRAPVSSSVIAFDWSLVMLPAKTALSRTSLIAVFMLARSASTARILNKVNIEQNLLGLFQQWLSRKS